MVPWWLPVDLPNISAIIDRLETWLVSIERSFQGLSVAIETVRIDEELMKIWPNEVCDKWDMLSMNFVVEFPLSSRHDAVMTMVDSVSKQAYFILMYTMVTVEGTARLFLYQVWKLHGLLKYIISDHRPQFIAHFTKELYCLLGIKLASSTTWHPQTNGQTECVNQELDQYLWLFVNE